MTKHSDTCQRVFNRYDATCPRCRELMAGSKPRAGWQKRYYEQQAAEHKAINAHFAPGGPHERGECGPVCTFGEW